MDNIYLFGDVVIPFFLTMPASAGFLDELSEGYLTSVDELPHNYNIKSYAGIQQYSGDIAARLEIAGYRDMFKQDGKFYISGNPADHAIIISEVGLRGYDEEKGDYLMTIGEASGTGIRYESLTSKLEMSQDGSRIEAKLTGHLTYHHICYSGTGAYTCKIGEETQTFYTYSDAPEQFNLNTRPNITIEQYQNIGIIRGINEQIGLMAYTITTPNGSVSHRMYAGIAENKSGVPYMNLTKMNIWKCTGSGICNIRDEIVMDNDIEIISMEYETPYGKYGVHPNITVKRMPQTSIQNYVIGLIGYIAMVVFGIKTISRI